MLVLSLTREGPVRGLSLGSDEDRRHFGSTRSRRFCAPDVDVVLAFIPIHQVVEQVLPQPASVWCMADGALESIPCKH